MPCPECGGEHPPGLCATYARLPDDDDGEPTRLKPPAPPQAHDRIPLGEGDRLGSFWLTKKLGSGATSEVFLVENEVTQARQAVKVLRPELHDDAEMVRRFESEARTTNMVRHEHVVEIHDIGVHAGWQHYIFLEALEGPTLGQLLQERIELGVTGRIALQLCAALGAAHLKGVIHRDLKPANVFVLQRNGGPHAKLVDFGMARREKLDSGEHRTRFGTIVGTALYMSPEQALGGEIDGRSDIYSLGILLFQMATGQLPFSAENPVEVIVAHQTKPPPSPRSLEPAISPGLEDVILRCLAKKPDDRWPTMEDLGRALAAALRGELAPAPVRTGPMISAQFTPAARAPVPLGAPPQKPGPPVPSAPGPAAPPPQAPRAGPVLTAPPALRPPPASAPPPPPAPTPTPPPAPAVAPPSGKPPPPVPSGPPAAAPRPASALTPASGFNARKDPRVPTSFAVQVLSPNGATLGDATVTDVSLGGAFVRTRLVLPLFGRTRLVGSTPQGSLDVSGDVVRVSQQKDNPGFGMRFEAIDAAQRHVLDGLLRARTGEAPGAGDPEAEAQLQQFEGRQSADLYGQLGVPRDTPTRKIREVCERLAEEMSPHRFPRLSAGQQSRLDALRLRLSEAEEVLVDQRRRALYDAINGNVLGVLRCITEGLSLEALDKLRTDFLRVRPDAEARARPAVARADEAVEAGDFAGGMQALADALCDDPLNLQLHRKAVEVRGRISR